MDLNEAAARLLAIIQDEIERRTQASYSVVRDRVRVELGDEWLTGEAGQRRNLCPKLSNAMRALPAYADISWNARRQRWTRAED